MINKNQIPKEILPYLLEIAHRLWAGHATIMIGAGFSKNAKKTPSSKKRFPTWNELGDIFYEKINGSSPKGLPYLNVLKLADEVQAAFGRNTLDQILKTEIPDKEYQPSKLHEKTLKLPWSDIFTTNYDTLLERTAERILQYRYETVVNKEDLVFSTKPRIIKLHGSFPSERPFIITEEDYRKYPIEYAPFVNTVQQSLLENTLCLVGFSGDDPNFLKWIGWIRDNLGKENSPKIFLVGILSLSIGQKRLLEERNIVPIDLSGCIGVDGKHEKALTFFIDFLTEQNTVEEKLNWPEKNVFFHFNESKDINEQVSEILLNWKELRIKYPNWLIVPDDRRDTLFEYTRTSESFTSNLSKINAPLDINFLFEYDWRLKMSLMPIDNNLIGKYEQVIENYNPFPTIFESDNAITPDSKPGFKWKEITQLWIELQLSMMRYYREEGIHEKWQALVERLEKIFHQFNSENIAYYHYERCLYYLFLLDIARLKEEINKWAVDNSLPYWEAKRAGLLAEVGDVSIAEKILEASLKTVRDKLNLSPVVNDYTLVSQEAYILQLLKYVKNSLNIIEGKFILTGAHDKDYSERWNTLIQFKCDPWSEFKIFNTFLEKKVQNFKTTEKKYGFDIGAISTTEHLGTDTYAQKSYSFLRYVEDIGMPFSLPGTSFGIEAARNAITYIANYSPYWAFASYMRLGDTKGIDTLFGRKALSIMSRVKSDELIHEYLKVLNDAKSEIINGDTFRNKRFAISLSTVLPEILSRLCVKSSYPTKMELLDFVEFVFNSEYRDRYQGIKNLSKRLIESLSFSEQLQIIPKLVKFPILPETNHITDNELIDPLYFLDNNLTTANRKSNINIDITEVNKLFEYAKKQTKERGIAISRLTKLYELNLLNKKQSELLGNILWSQCDENTGFPSGTNFYYFAFLNFPHPKSIVPSELLRNYINTSELPIQTNESQNGISISRGDFAIFHNILGTINKNITYTWTDEDIIILVEKLVDWWDLDKQYLYRQDRRLLLGSIQDEFKSRFENLTSILAYIIAPHIEILTEENKTSIFRIIKELPKYNMSSLKVESAFYNYIEDKTILTNKLVNTLFSSQKSAVIDALQGVLVYLKAGYENPEPFITAICDNIKCSNEVNLTGNLTVTEIIVREHNNLLTIEQLKSIKIGLINLMEKVKIKPEDSIKTIDFKLRLKIKAADLTLSLKRYYEKNNLDIPSYILDWKKSCLDNDEFSEIRKIWKDE